MTKRILSFIYGFVALHLIWLLAAFFVQSKALVSPVEVYGQLTDIFRYEMWEHVAASFGRIVKGLLLSLLLGIPAGLLMANSPRIDKICTPLLYFTYPIPKLALLPVVMLLFGIDEAAKIIMIVLILVFQIIVATRDAVRNIPKEDFHVFASLGAGRMKTLRWITLPAILPEVLTSLRIAIGTAISVLFFTETFGTDRGLGFYIVDTWMRLAYTNMYAGILILSLMGFLLYLLIDICDEYFCRWKG